MNISRNKNKNNDTNMKVMLLCPYAYKKILYYNLNQKYCTINT
jgi:hypothetical protein